MAKHVQMPGPSVEKPEFLSPKEVAAIVRVHERTVIRWIRNGDIRAFRVQRTIRVNKADVIRLLNQAMGH